MTIVALTHPPSPRMDACVRTYAAPATIDVGRATRQHAAYRDALAAAGAEVRILDVNRDEPDAVFIEDTAVVLDAIAILTAMGAPARQGEPERVAAVLATLRPVARITDVDRAATLEGGDVLRVGRILFVGLTERTNEAGAAALATLAGPHGYEVRRVPVAGCLHLKSACTALPDGSLLVNRAWLPEVPPGFAWVDVADDEPNAANVVVVGDEVLASASYPRTTERIAAAARQVHRVDISELEKADGSVTCLSLLVGPRSNRTMSG